jgi:hypothetical protein
MTMQTNSKIPDYIADDFSLYLENMESLTDPENPELLSNYLNVLSSQLADDSAIFSGLNDQLAMAINASIRINIKTLVNVDLTNEPEWADIKPHVGVHANARATITELMTHSEQALKIAVLLVHFYNIYDATPLGEEVSDDEYESNNDDFDHYEDQY